MFNRQERRSRRLRGGADDEGSSGSKKRKLTSNKTETDGQTSLKAILDIPELSNELKQALGDDVRPMDEIRDPALYIQIGFEFNNQCNNMDDFVEVHRLQLSSKNTLFQKKSFGQPPWVLTDSLRNVVDDLLSKSIREVNVLTDAEGVNCTFDMEFRFLFSERRLEKDIEKFSDEDIRHRLNILRSEFRWDISPFEYVTYSNGNRIRQKGAKGTKQGTFFHQNWTLLIECLIGYITPRVFINTKMMKKRTLSLC